MHKKRVRTQNAILKAAHSLFEKHGFEQTSMESIAEKAEIAAGTLYNYYGSKSILLMAIFADLTQKIRNNPPKRREGKVDEEIGLADIVTILQFVVKSTLVFPKPIMRQILAQLFILDADDVAELVAMDMKMVAMLYPILSDMQQANLVAEKTDIDAAALLLFGCAMIQFQTYISVEEMTEDMLNEAIAQQTELMLLGLLIR